jgi:hypothetical protein
VDPVNHKRNKKSTLLTATFLRALCFLRLVGEYGTVFIVEEG